MATTERTQRQSLYPPEHPRKRKRYYFDDTLDAYPPYHLLLGPSTPEEIAAARAKAIERGLLPPDHPAHPDHRDARGDVDGSASAAGRAKKAAKRAARKK
jgi:hypothetical protein